MPLGNQTQSNNKQYYLRIRTQDKDKHPIAPEFEVKTKGEGGEQEVTSARKVAGNLVAVKVNKRTIQAPAGAMEVDDVKIVLEDAANEEVYFLDARPNNLTRGLYNSLLALKSGENVSISLYQTKPNEQGKVYPAISVWQNDKQIKWLYDKSQLPEVEEIKNKKQEVISRDFTDLNEFFFEKLKGLVSTFTKSAPPAKQDDGDTTDKASPKTAKKGGKKAEKTPDPLEEDVQSELDNASTDDIPF